MLIQIMGISLKLLPFNNKKIAYSLLKKVANSAIYS